MVSGSSSGPNHAGHDDGASAMIASTAFCSWNTSSSAAKWVAIARFIESEQAATGDEDQRVEAVEAAAKTLCPSNAFTPRWEALKEWERANYRDEAARLLNAGWTPPENEDEK